MKDSNLTGTLLEQDVRRTEADKQAERQSIPLEDVISHARDEIAAVFSKQRQKPVVVSR